MKIFITMPQNDLRDTFITPKVLERLNKLGETEFNPSDKQLSPEQLFEVVKNADVLITGWGTLKIDEHILKNADKLKMVAHTGGSVGDLVDEYVYRRGVKVLSGNDIYAQSVAEGCLCYTISALRRIDKYVGLVRTGGWHGDGFENRGLFGKKVGLIGFGAIAKYFSKMLRLFNTQTMVFSKHLTDEEIKAYGVTRAGIEEIFETCDVISLHSALTHETRGMINKDLISRIQANSLLVNTARGALIDEYELVAQLKTGRFYAALDVFTKEPLPTDSPLRTLPNVLPLPHMGGPTVDMREQVVFAIVEDIKNYMEGKPLANEISYDYSLRMTRKN